MTRPLAPTILALAAAVVALSACAVVEREPELHLSVLGPTLSGSDTFVVRVDTTGVDRARLLVDGVERVGTVPIGADVPVTVSGEGRHTLHARVYRGASAQDSAPLEVKLDTRAPLATLSPAPGVVVDPSSSFTVIASFDEELDPASVTPESATLKSTRTSAPVEATVALSADRRSVTVRAAKPLVELDEVYLVLQVRDLVGHLSFQGAETWRAPSVISGEILVEPGSGLSLHGVVQIGARWEGAPDRGTMRVDGVAIGDVASGELVPWDTALSPSGTHVLSLDAHGYRADFFSRTVVTSNGAARLVSCAAKAPGFSVEAVFDQPVSIVAWGDGQPPFACDYPDVHALERVRCEPKARFASLPTEWQLSFAGAIRTASGEALASDAACTVAVPTWRAPWGDGPLQDEAGPLRAIDVVIGNHQQVSGGAGWETANLYRIGPTGKVEILSAQAGAPFTRSKSFATDGTQLRTDASSSSRVWLAALAGSADVGIGNERGVGGLQPLARPAGGAVRLARTTSDYWPAFTELDGTGRRVLRVATPTSNPTGWSVSDPGNATADGSVTDAAADGETIAFVEAGADGVGLLRVRSRGADGWTSPGDVLNADATRPASEPAIARDALAWVEGGTVWVRTGGAPWSGAVDLGSASGAAGRSPRVSGTFDQALVFVERENGKDRFEVRRRAYGASTWETYASLPTDGEVRSFAVFGSLPVILWIDAAGDVRLRVATQ
jgi:hypothetical protein